MKRKIIITSLFACFSACVFADITTAPYIGRVTGSAAVSNSLGIFGGDAMLPALGNENGFVYADLNGDGSTSTSWLVSPGLGFRNVINNVIYGAYGYGDYQVSNLGGNFWVMNPGVEVMTPRWDVHLNGYIAIDRVSQNGTRNFADTFGITQGILPVGNTLEDTQVTPVAVFGNGLDMGTGYSFPYKKNLRARVSVGGYYYQAPLGMINVTENIVGITGGLRLALSPSISVSVNDSYDGVFSNIASLSLAYSFGSADNDNLYSDDVHDRLLAPDIRHIGILGTGAGQMAQQGYIDPSEEMMQFGDVFYFDPMLSEMDPLSQIVGAGGLGVIVPGQCTAESPCAGSLFDQATIDQLNVDAPNTNFYLSTGTFAATGGLTFHAGQNIYGWDTGFLTPVSGSNRPLINDTVTFAGGNNIMQNMQVNGQTLNMSTFEIPGVYITAGNVSISNSYITVSAAGQAGVAVSDYSAGTVSISDSTLEAAGASTAIAVVDDHGIINIDNSVLVALTSFVFNQGMAIRDGAVATITNSSLSATAASGGTLFGMGGGGTVNFLNSSLSMTNAGGTNTVVVGGGTTDFTGSTCTINSIVVGC